MKQNKIKKTPSVHIETPYFAPVLKIGIIREWKEPADKRAVLSPEYCQKIQKQYKELVICVESSPDRIFSDQEYAEKGIQICENLSDCDLLLGVKEIPVEKLVAGKTYLFFAHVIKKQLNNQKLMQALIQKKIKMIDFELLTDDKGNRLIGFGEYAGMAGAYNGFLTYGKKHKLFDLPPAYTLSGYDELLRQVQANIKGDFKIVVTGTGRVGKGVMRFMKDVGIAEFSPQEYLTGKFKGVVFTQLGSADLYARKSDGGFDKAEFYKYPENYKSIFTPFLKETDLLMNGIFWHEKMARLFEKEAIQAKDYSVSVIADISCDIEGSIPITYKATDIYNPVYGVSRNDFSMTKPFLQETIDIMAVANLPCELAADASTLFSEKFAELILPEFLQQQKSEILERATICSDGKLMPKFSYLKEYSGL